VNAPASAIDVRQPVRLAGLFWLACATAGAAVFFLPGIDSLVEAWVQPEYSHGPLIPIVSAFLLLRQLKTVPAAPVGWTDRLPGLALLVVALLLAVFGRVIQISDFVAYAMILWVGAMLLIGFGWSRGHALWPPVFHLVYMLPLPGALYYGVSTWLQGVSSELGVFFLRLMDVPVYLDGNIIDLGVYKLEVAEACSGLRYLFPILSFSYIFAVLYRGPIWHKAVLLIAAAPLSVLMNSVRIAIAGVVVDRYGLAHVEGITHFLEGWVIFVTCVALLFGLARVLLFFRSDRPRLVDALDLETDGIWTQFLRLGRAPAMVLPAVVMLALAASVTVLPERVPAPIARDSFATFPRGLGAWRMQSDSRLDPGIERVLRADDYMVRLYEAPASDAWVELFAAWYVDQSRGGTHSPEVCLPAGGWEIASLRQIDAPGADGMFTLNRALIQKGLERMLVYYWYDQQGLRTASSFRSRFILTLAKLKTGRSDGALVRLTTPIRVGETEADAEARLQALLKAADGPLAQALPGE